MTEPSSLPELAERRAGFLLSVAVMASLVLISTLSGNFGRIGPDGDDVMRLVQLRDLMRGQGWFDLTQYRMGPEGGTAMHWSRLVDLPMLVIASTLSPMIGEEAALAAAFTLWPVISVVIVVAGLVAGARGLGGGRVVAFAAIIAFVILFRHYRFLPGAIDHHNVQLGLLILSACLVIAPSRGPAPMILSAAVLAAAMAVGAEVYVLIAAICAFVAIDWGIRGEPAAQGTIGFGATFAMILALSFGLTVGPMDYNLVHCDALSSATLVIGSAGALGLALAARRLSGAARAYRLAALGAIGTICVVLALLIAPQCLSNPLSNLPPEVQTLWLGRIDEARPSLAYLPGQPGEVAFRLAMPVMGALAAAFLAWRNIQRRAMLLLLVLTTLSIVLMLYQTRYYVFGHVFAVLPLALLAAEIHAGALRGVPRLAYLAVLMVSFPVVWSGALAFTRDPAPGAGTAGLAQACALPEALAALNDLLPGRILAPASDGPMILKETPHSVLYGNYHRNSAGIRSALAIFLAEPEAARARLSGERVSYLLYCPADPDMRFFAQHAPEGFIGRIQAGDVPGWLVAEAEAGGTVIYRVRWR